MMDYLIQDESNSARDRLLILADGPGATQVISFDLPLRSLRETGHVEVAMVDESSFNSLSPREAEQAVCRLMDAHNPTRVLASRFGAIGAHAIAEQCSRRNIKLVVHLDDNLFEVPESLGPAKYLKYNDQARLSRLRLLSERADLIYASTTELKVQLESLGIGTPIRAGDIYCALPVSTTPWKKCQSSMQTIGYMGTVGHAEDLASIVPAIIQVMTELPNTQFATFGSIKMPDLLLEKFPERCIVTKSKGSYEEFLNHFKDMHWSCGLAPLVNTRFNRCKANTKFVEYSIAGIPVVASASPVYNAIIGDSNGRLANSNKEWAESIIEMLLHEASAEQYVRNAQRYLEENNSMQQLTQQVGDVLELSCE